MAGNQDVDLSALNSLSAEHRATVSAALKSTLARELTRVGAVAKAADGAAEHTRESGPLHGSQHSRESGSSSALDSVVSQLHTMDEQQFQTFTSRLAQLKQLGGGSTGGG